MSFLGASKDSPLSKAIGRARATMGISALLSLNLMLWPLDFVLIVQRRITVVMALTVHRKGLCFLLGRGGYCGASGDL